MPRRKIIYDPLEYYAYDPYWSHSIQRRARAIFGFYRNMTVKDIANKYGVSKSSVYRWIKDYREIGDERFEGQVHAGRQSSVQHEVAESILQALTASPKKYGFRSNIWSTEQLRIAMLKKHSVPLTRQSIYRFLLRNDFLYEKNKGWLQKVKSKVRGKDCNRILSTLDIETQKLYTLRRGYRYKR